MLSPQEMGRLFEREFVAEIGGRLVPGSGSTPRAKLDVDQATLLWSLKWTAAESYRLTAADVREAVAGARGPGSRMVLPLLGVRIAGVGESISVARTSDLLAMLRGEVETSFTHARRSERLAAADPLARLRDV